MFFVSYGSLLNGWFLVSWFSKLHHHPTPSPFHVSLSFAPNWGEGFKSFADVAPLSLSSKPDEEDEDVELEGFEGQLQWVEGMHF